MKRLWIFLVCTLTVFSLYGCVGSGKVTNILPAQDVVEVEGAGQSALQQPVQPAPQLGANGLAMLPPSQYELDLNQDGEPELVTVAAGEDGDAALEIIHGGGTFSEQYEYMAGLECCWGDMTGGDGHVELILMGDTGSEDYVSMIYTIAGGQLHVDEVYGLITGILGDGEFTVATTVDVLGTHPASCTFYMSEDFLSEPFSAYELTGPEQSRTLTLLRDDLPVLLMEEDGSMPLVTLPRGSELLLVGTDGASYALLQNLADGSMARLELVWNEMDAAWYVDDISEQEWFGGLNYAG